MAEGKIILTYAGLRKYEEELQDLKVNKRHDIALKIKEAREQGDLSENAEYDAAKDEQRDIEARIEELEALLKKAEVIDEDEASTDAVGIGCVVRIRDMTEKEDLEFKIAGSTEASSLNGCISNESPVGKALMGHTEGQTVTVEMPDGKFKYKILKITKDN